MTAGPTPLALQALGTARGSPFEWEGRLSSRSTAWPNIYSGNQAPSATVVPAPRQGDYYFRTDTGIAATSLYIYSGAAWVAVSAVAAATGLVELTGQTAAIPATTILTPPSAGEYAVGVYEVCTTAGVAGTLHSQVNFSDGTASRNISPAADITLGATNFSQGMGLIHTDTTAVQYTTTLTGVVGNPVYSLFITVQRLS